MEVNNFSFTLLSLLSSYQSTRGLSSLAFLLVLLNQLLGRCGRGSGTTGIYEAQKCVEMSENTAETGMMEEQKRADKRRKPMKTLRTCKGRYSWDVCVQLKTV